MLSLWPFKGEDQSPASFEKALSALAVKITQSQTHLDSLRSNSRRTKALWTLYSSVAYLLYFIVLFLVVGWRNWTALEYSAVAGSPLLMYLVRAAISAYYTYRIDNASHRLEDQQALRTKTIDKLKAATKYDSTQQLLEKYGGAPPKKENKPASKSPKSAQKQNPPRMGGAPPATANIQRPNQLASLPSTPQPKTQTIENRAPSQVVPSPVEKQIQPDLPGFAPNAFSSPPQYAQATEADIGSHWYDRVLDLLMGEDETSPRNRIVLICQNCRLVNGQAPPGMRTPAEIGRWKCFGCGSLNGEEDEAARVVQEMKERIETGPVSPPIAEPTEKGGVDDEDDDIVDSEEVASAEDITEVKPKRGRPKGSKRKA